MKSSDNFAVFVVLITKKSDRLFGRNVKVHTYGRLLRFVFRGLFVILLPQIKNE